MTRGNIDARLLPFLYAATEEATQQELELLLTRHIAPVVEAVLHRRLRQSIGFPSHDRERADADDVRGDVNVHLLTRLGKLKRDPAHAAIEDVCSYAAVITLHTYEEYVRGHHPGRWRLKNQVRYFLTHDDSLALWQGAAGEWLAGFAFWRGTEKGFSAPRQRLASVPKARGAEMAEEVANLVAKAGRPLPLEEVVSRLAALWNVTDRSADSSRERHRERHAEEGDAAVSPVEPRSDFTIAIGERERLERLFAEIARLPPRQCAALLLNLRDGQGGRAIDLFSLTGAASLRRIAAVLGMPAKELAELWPRLPLDDAVLGARLGVSRQQVINLRKAARARLARRMAATGEHAARRRAEIPKALGRPAAPGAAVMTVDATAQSVVR